MDQTPVELAETFADVARALLDEDDVEATLIKITALAVETIDGCDHSGVSLIEGRRVSTPAASDDVPVKVDAIQYELDQGPCLDAIRDHETFRVDDLASEDRWPAFSRRAAEETGVASMLSFRLFAQGDTMGALNLYSKQQSAFDDEALAVGRCSPPMRRLPWPVLSTTRRCTRHSEPGRDRPGQGHPHGPAERERRRGVRHPAPGVAEDEHQAA